MHIWTRWFSFVRLQVATCTLSDLLTWTNSAGSPKKREEPILLPLIPFLHIGDGKIQPGRMWYRLSGNGYDPAWQFSLGLIYYPPSFMFRPYWAGNAKRLCPKQPGLPAMAWKSLVPALQPLWGWVSAEISGILLSIQCRVEQGYESIEKSFFCLQISCKGKKVHRMQGLGAKGGAKGVCSHRHDTQQTKPDSVKQSAKPRRGQQGSAGRSLFREFSGPGIIWKSSIWGTDLFHIVHLLSSQYSQQLILSASTKQAVCPAFSVFM